MSRTMFTPTEAAALLDVPERRIRKEFEHGLLPKRKRPVLRFDALVYLQSLQNMEIELGVKDRKRLLRMVRGALRCAKIPRFIHLSGYLRLTFGAVVDGLAHRVRAFDAWKQQLVVDEEILGGEPVFPGTRLAVRNIGGLLSRDESAGQVMLDYPYLDDQDLEFAALYTRAYPRVGRPRATAQAATR